MPQIIGVQFGRTGKIYYFDSESMFIDEKQHVIVETARGIEYARVALASHWVPESEIVAPLKPIIRVATEEDDAIHEENLAASKDAYAICKEKITYCNLEMKLVNVEYTFDRGKIVVNFTADDRVDFRELIKELAQAFHTRIELRQIGVRDEARIIGGIGICGEPLCCHRFLTDFSPVSIKMAKEQSISLNPTKISGCCGRLLCCLNYENEHYVESNRLAKEAARQAREQGKAEGEACEGCQGKCPMADEGVIVAESDDVIEVVTLETPKPAKHESKRPDKREKRERQDKRHSKQSAKRSPKAEKSENGTEIFVEDYFNPLVEYTKEAAKNDKQPRERRVNLPRDDKRKPNNKNKKPNSDHPARDKKNRDGKPYPQKKDKRPRKRGSRGGRGRNKNRAEEMSGGDE